MWYRKAAEQGSAKGQNNLGWMYAHGRGVTKDEEQAVIWYRKAAEQKNAQAQDNLGFMYANGRGVVRNDQQAGICFHKSAKQQVADVQASMDKFSERFSCYKWATTKLFGVEIKCATRDVLRVAVKHAGAVIKQNDTGYFVDIYYSERLECQHYFVPRLFSI